ncbi:T9SS type A sorting domain-containing protein [Dyadobacter sp. NIV53]|uniref:leucine-rich repeat domain-containing protein n=1 Tax=Dyadobacter sp. NIV53 TaxID=2861765 RepID=UPI001C8881A3|nr:T9SS type A sorting domain-containing protein [Dyadobacter sp. NIV53]
MKLFSSLFALLFTYQIHAQSLESDRLALIDLFKSTNGSSWAAPTYGWDISGLPGDNPCGWQGVSCNGGRVTSISLPQKNLSGNVPASLSNLSELTYLDLAINNLTGEIPAELGNLKKLIHFNLPYNQLTGVIPAQLGQLTSLVRLHLAANQFTGSIPLELGNLASLELLELSANKLTGGIPVQLGKLKKLRDLYLSENQLSETIPIEIGNLVNLKTIYLHNNQLTGFIPTSIGNLIVLETLHLYSNMLSGVIPAAIGNCIKLQDLSLTHNNISGSIPPELGKLINLSGLSLAGNQLSGTIPDELGLATSLIDLSLGTNQIYGEIPSTFANLTLLAWLNLSSARLSGNIPDFIGTLPNLKYLYLHSNRFSGRVPDLKMKPEDSDINLSDNRFTFDGLETNSSVIDQLQSQAFLPLINNIGVLSVHAGGTIENNTYYWYKNDVQVATVVGDSSYKMSEAGTYRVVITNKKVPQLTLYSNDYMQADNPLPVTLASFTGKHTLNGNLLEWHTTEEFDNTGFEIERSVDAKSFIKIGFADGKGNTALQSTYRFLDISYSSTDFYRLKQLDYNGNVSYSRIIRINSAQDSFNVYPNPATISVTIDAPHTSRNIKILNLNGQIIYDLPAKPSQTISTSNLQSGTYIFQTGEYLKKITVQK